jgi:glycosyltransferase involved in cell wall biosynthesis
MPMTPSREPQLEALRRDPWLTHVQWHPLPERRLPGIAGRLRRMLGTLPADMAKVAMPENVARLEAVRAALRPTVELAVSSWALAAYRGQAFAEGTRLFMVNVDHEIVRQAMPAVLTAQAVGKALLRKLACAIDRPKVLAISKRALSTAGRVGAISPADVATLNRLGGRSDVAYVPPLMRPWPLDRSGAIPGSVLITTNFTYSPNVESLGWFLREVWPRVSPEAKLTIAGLDDGGQLAALCRRHPRVTYAGWLDPAALDDAFAKTALAVNPTRTGSGFQVKLLDAIARGVPIVSTAWSNKLGPAIPSSDNAAELAALITARLDPGSNAPFDYEAFYREAVAAWERFLFATA